MDDPETQDVAGQGDGGDDSGPPPMSESLGMPSGMAGLPTVPGLAQPGGPAPVRGSDAPKRHGGLLTGLVGVLLDGLTAGVTTPQGPQGMEASAARAMQLPQQRQQQAQAAETATQQHQIQLAQMHVQMQQIKHMAASLNDQDLEGLTDTQKAVVGQAVKDGGLELIGEANDREAAFKKAQELATQNKGEALNYMPLIARHDADGNPVWGVYQLRGKNTLSSDQAITISGSDEFKIPDDVFHAPAGMPWADAMKVYVQKTRDMQAKINAANAAKIAASKADPSQVIQVMQGGKPQNVLINKRTGKVVANEGEAPPKASTAGGDVAINTQAKMLVEGDLDPSQVSKRSGTQGAILSAADQYSQKTYGKPYDPAQQQADYKFASSTQTQNTLKYLNSLTGSDNKSGNLGDLVAISDKLTRTRFPALNDIAAWGRLEAGDPQIAQYHTAVTEVADQVAKILQGGGSGTSDAKLKQAQDLFRTGFNKGQLKAVSTTLRGLLANRKRELIGDNVYLKKQYGRQAATADRDAAEKSDPFAQFGGSSRSKPQ